jgi:hypothetical protein
VVTMVVVVGTRMVRGVAAVMDGRREREEEEG